MKFYFNLGVFDLCLEIWRDHYEHDRLYYIYASIGIGFLKTITVAYFKNHNIPVKIWKIEWFNWTLDNYYLIERLEVVKTTVKYKWTRYSR